MRRLVKSQTSGVYSGLTVILDAELHDYNITSSATVGFKVSIQSPDDFARTEKIGFMVTSLPNIMLCLNLCIIVAHYVNALIIIIMTDIARDSGGCRSHRSSSI